MVCVHGHSLDVPVTMPSMDTRILGIRIRSEGLAQVMTKRNASEYLIGSIQRYPRAILSSPG